MKKKENQVIQNFIHLKKTQINCYKNIKFSKT